MSVSLSRSKNDNPPSHTPTKLVDRFGRIHRSLRLSVTDRCNIRCFYCMPEVGAQFVPRQQLLTFEEIHRLVHLMVGRLGICKIRVTGGEPLVRRELPKLIKQLSAIDGLEDLSLTTNGVLLADQAAQLRQAGLSRINISLDTLDPETFQRITRRSGLDQIIAGIDAAIEAGFDSIKLNALAIAGVTESEVVDLVRFAFSREVTMRFIEFMPLDADRSWTQSRVLSGDQLLQILESGFGKVRPIGRTDAAQPAEEFEIGDPSSGGLANQATNHSGRVGIIRSVTKPFCSACDRLRLTADGAIRNCLFATDETRLRDAIRDGATDEDLIEQIERCVSQKKASHGIDDNEFKPPERAMYSIGG